ncbi:syntaxin-7 [Condylostylus longicornis]|uniref:syntaxin-7 n=1 Tax=Condylostylus longicornis TaxID=2530218 RepID=UPI00244DE572|nr:syntaxin-7 [Condylostylus longicornis]XP_055376303.1 syntaxin-7 [Condylostylus longicornis]
MESNVENPGLSEAEFQRICQTIATSIQKVLQNVNQMNRMVNQINTPQDSPDLKKQLHQLMTYTHQLVEDTNGLVKELDKSKDRSLKIQRDRMVDEFTSALTSFQQLQRKTVEIEKNVVRQARANQYNISKPPGANQSRSLGSFFEDNFTNRNNKTNTQIQIQQEEIDLEALEEQERAIRELEANIAGVNEIYKKLGAMVYEQGLVVDSIESNVEQTSVFVATGSENLRKASQYKNKLRKRKVIIGSVLFAVLIIIMTIIIVQIKN